MHTPGKWIAETDGNFYHLHKINSVIRIATINNKADAERICLTHNSFEGLLEALKAFVTEYDNLPKEEAQSLIGRIQKLFTNARTAIARAEETNG